MYRTLIKKINILYFKFINKCINTFYIIDLLK